MNVRKALVVDDSRLARVALTRLLLRLGVDVETADSGAEALTAVRGETPDVVFLDYMMPDMDGFEAASALSKLPEAQSVPLVMYTSQNTPEDRARAIRCGISGFLVKPVSEDALREVLEGLPTRPQEPLGPEPETADDTQDMDSLLPEVDFFFDDEQADSAPEPVTDDGALRRELESLVQQSVQDAVAVMRAEAAAQAGDTAEAHLAEAHDALINEAEQAARAAASEVARKVAEDVASTLISLHRPATGAAVPAEPDPGAVDRRLRESLPEIMRQDVFRQQLLSVLQEHAVPVLKNALDEWVRQLARSAAREAVQDVVQEAVQVVVDEAVVASAETAAEEMRQVDRRPGRWQIAGFLLLAIGVGVAIMLAL